MLINFGGLLDPYATFHFAQDESRDPFLHLPTVGIPLLPLVLLPSVDGLRLYATPRILDSPLPRVQKGHALSPFSL